MEYDEFCRAAKAAGCTYLLKETTEYSDIDVSEQRYAEAYSTLAGCWTAKTGGKIFTIPYKRWSKSGRKFIKIPL